MSEYRRISWQQALIVGFTQPLALIPGTSRSGVTITAGLFSGLSRSAAAKFSFFLGIPITGIAGAYGLLQSLEHAQSYSIQFYILGFVSALIFGLFAIRFLIRYLKKQRYTVFAIYRIVLALFIVAFIWLA